MSRHSRSIGGRTCVALALLAAVLGCSSSDTTSAAAAAAAAAARPNVLFVLMDDVGIDQLQRAMLDRDVPGLPATPVIDTVARSGVRFQEAWSMPACSTTRNAIFEGRFPLRTGVKGPLGDRDLANAMSSPYATTLPRLLARQGYQSGMFGKYHIALQSNNAAGHGIVRAAGWDHFAGWLDVTGDPSSIDTTAGGVGAPGTYACGFVPGRRADPVNGADRGACYTADGGCVALTVTGGVPPGRQCLERGGLLEPEAACTSPRPARLDFGRLQSHYVSPVVYDRSDGSLERVPAEDPRARTWRARFAVDEALSWIRSRPAGTPWMATVSLASVHTPLVPPPTDPDSPANLAASGMDCRSATAQRELSNLMIESLDRDLGRLLLSLGLASRSVDGSLRLAAREANTMVVIAGDNGSLGSTVKLPFDPSRAKGTAYQTGVWVPLMVAGPLVAGEPGRAVSAMVNLTDLYALFAGFAGIDDVGAAVPSRTVDAVPMLAYLTDPSTAPARAWNYTEVGVNAQANGAMNGPCTIGATCTQIPIDRGVCEDNNGTWWGEGTTAAVNGVRAPSAGFAMCCQVVDFMVRNRGEPVAISPLTSVAVRDRRFKLVENTYRDYGSSQQTCVDRTQVELYDLGAPGEVLALDREAAALPLAALQPAQQAAYTSLAATLASIRASAAPCAGDGNGDGVVDERDLSGWSDWAAPRGWGLSSVFDLNLDGRTDALDRTLVASNLGRVCR